MLSLERHADRAHAVQDISSAVRRMVPHEGLLLVLVEPGTGELRLAYREGVQLSYPTLEAELASAWRDAVADAAMRKSDTSAGVAYTFPLAGGEASVGVMTVFLDAGATRDQLKQLEALGPQAALALEGARRAEQADEKRRLDAISDASAAIAHELRNPILGISSAVQLLRFRSRDDPVVERNVGRILREVEKLNGMVNDLVEYARPRPLVLEAGDPATVWDRVIEGNRGLVESGGLQFRRTREGSARVMFDPERLGHAFLAVLALAAEGAQPGSTLAMHSRVLSGDTWHCTLHSDGWTIPAEEMTRMFDILHSSRKTGRTIGLALCRRILDQHGGGIALTSVPGEGTTISISLPLAQ